MLEKKRCTHLEVLGIEITKMLQALRLYHSAYLLHKMKKIE